MFVFENTAYTDNTSDFIHNETFPEKGWLVNREGQKVDSTYKGRKYTIIDKEILTLSWEQRLRGFVRLALVVCALAVHYFSLGLLFTLVIAVGLGNNIRKFLAITTCRFYLKKLKDTTLLFEVPEKTEALPGLPQEMFEYILYFANPAALIKSCPQVNKVWYHSANDITLWKKRCTQHPLGLRSWQDYFKNLDFKLSDLSEGAQTICRETFERIEKNPFLKDPEPTIPLFAYQYLDLTEGRFDLVLNPNIRILDVLVVMHFKESLYDNVRRLHNYTNSSSEFFGYSLSCWRQLENLEIFNNMKSISGPYWMLISKEPIVKAIRSPWLSDLWAVERINRHLLFSLPTISSLVFYQALTYQPTPTIGFLTKGYYDGEWSVVGVDERGLSLVDHMYPDFPIGAHACLVI